MSWETAQIGVLGVLVSALSFLLGKVFSQSEVVLDQKRQAYKDFLEFCPSPNEVHFEETVSPVELQRRVGVLTLYGSQKALLLAGKYFEDFADAQPGLIGKDIAGHPEFLKVMTSYNRMVWEMRNDAMTWSLFAPSRSNREYKPSVNLET